MDCPPGLEYLITVDQVLVQQKVELLEAFTSWETANQYIIKNSLGQPVYHAKEESNCCYRQCCGSCRAFDLSVRDNAGNEVLRAHRPLRCQSCWCFCCLQNMEVFAAGEVIGRVEQDCTILYPCFTIKDVNGKEMLKISGPLCTWNCFCKDVVFDVKRDGIIVGRISKQWAGIVREAFTDADHFGVSFPMDLDVKMKATLVGAVFLIDFMFFEETATHKNRDTPGMLDL